MIIIAIVNTILILLFFSGVFYFTHQRLSRKDVFSRYTEILATLEKCQNMAYAKVFRDDVLVQNASGFKINKKEMDKFQSKYLKLTFNAFGSNLVKDLVMIFGDLESISILLANDFVNRIEQDENIITNMAVDKGEEKLMRGISTAKGVRS